MVLTLYSDLISQPSRVLYLFLKTNNIEHVHKTVSLLKSEHSSAEYAKEINPFKKVPAIDHNGFKLAESVAILRYLVREFSSQVPDHWYPKNSKERARVDEFLEWHHSNLHVTGSGFFRSSHLEPMVYGSAVNADMVKYFSKGLEVSLQQLEDIFLSDGRRFLCGSEISVADLFGACEVEQPWCGGYDVFNGRPKLRAWMDNVRERLQPDYDDAHSSLNSVTQKLKINKSA